MFKTKFKYVLDPVNQEITLSPTKSYWIWLGVGIALVVGGNVVADYLADKELFY